MLLRRRGKGEVYPYSLPSIGPGARRPDVPEINLISALLMATNAAIIPIQVLLAIL